MSCFLRWKSAKGIKGFDDFISIRLGDMTPMIIELVDCHVDVGNSGRLSGIFIWICLQELTKKQGKFEHFPLPKIYPRLLSNTVTVLVGCYFYSSTWRLVSPFTCVLVIVSLFSWAGR